MSYKTLARRIERHRSVLRRLTPGKLANLTTLLWELKRRVTTVRSAPIFARINVCSVCNLSCPGCAVYADKTGADPYLRPKGMMRLEVFDRIIDALKGSLLEAVLYDEGEPLLNKRIWEMVRHASAARVRTVISTNLSFDLRDDTVDELLDSGLDYLIVALDGFTQETYQRHRQGGDVALVKENLERILARRRNGGRGRGVEVEVQFIEFDHNAHEKAQVVDYARRVGADQINCFASYSEELSDVRSLEGRPRRHFGCFDLYAIADFDVDGTLFPCDFQEDLGADGLGNVVETPFRELWNSPRMAGLRADFSRREATPLQPECARCPITRGLPSVLR